ncbi:unnamed protein product [Prunus brigantina]
MGKSRAAAPKRTETKLKTKSAGASKRTSKKAGKDPNKPKRPASAFFVFMEDFREKYKKEHPNNKSVAAVGKAGGDKWKSLSDAEKAPYVAKAEKRKTEYNKTMQAYNKSIAEGGNGAEEEESDKSKSEVNNEEEEDDESAEDSFVVSLLDHPVSILHNLILILMRNTSLALLYCPVELCAFNKLQESREVRRG